MTTESPGYFDVVFDGPPSHESGRFVEVEDEQGRSFDAGEWIQDGDLWRLRIARILPSAEREALVRADSILTLIWHRYRSSIPPAIEADFEEAMRTVLKVSR
jgi:hypothetical protein